MDSESEELYLMKMKQFVFDEDKIVTVPWLSNQLQLNITSTHALMKQFVNDEENNKLGISYTLTGITKDWNQASIIIVKHDELEEKRKLFKNISSELVYSIQKAVDVNFNIIANVDLLKIHGDNGAILGCVVSKRCVFRNNFLNKKNLPATTRVAGTDKSKASHLLSTKPNTSLANNSIKEEVANKTEGRNKFVKQNSGDKKNVNSQALANMFGKAPPKKEKLSECKQEIKSEPIEAMDIDDEDTDIKTLGKNQNISKESSKNKTAGMNLYDSDTDEEAKKIEIANGAKSENKRRGRKTSNKRQRDDKSIERAQKKRKRIVQHIDSDEDIFADEDDEIEMNESIINDSDDDTTQKQTQALPARNKKRKYVDKTYTDEEGYVVTKKVLVYESAESEEDEKENPPKIEALKKKEQKEIKQSSPSSKKKKEIGRAANQPTLMNFFKRK